MRRNFIQQHMLPAFALLCAVVVCVAWFARVEAAPNFQINYQGKLTDPSNSAVADGTYQMEFNLYTQASGGSPVWTETLSGADEVQVQSGLFSVMLGSTSPLTNVDFDQTLYLGVTIEADAEMTPRKILGTVPASFIAEEANNAATLGGVASTSFVRSDQADTVSGLLTFSNGLISQASSTITDLTTITATTTYLSINGERFSDLTGTGLQNNSGVLTVNTTYLDTLYATSTEFDTCSELATILSGQTTGTCGSLVLSVSPTLTGTVNAAALTLSSTLTLSGSAANIALGSNYLSGDGGDEGIFVDSSGRIGVNTSAPSSALEVVGDILTRGTSWATSSQAETNTWRGVTYGNGLFVAVAVDGTNRVMTSPDGIRWTARSAAQANLWRSVTYGNGLFVAVSSDGTNRVMTSPDGITWTVRSAAEANQWFSVTYGNGLFVAVAQSGTNRVMTSPDGITWTARSAAEANSWYSVTYGNGRFVAVSTTGTNRVMYSTDGITWNSASASAANTWTSVTYGDGLFVAVSSDGTNPVMTSVDGTSWTARSTGGVSLWNAVAYGDGVFVAVSSTDTSTSTSIMTSPDGITWTVRPGAEANFTYAVTYGNGRFVAVDGNGENRVSYSGAMFENRLAHNNIYQGGATWYGNIGLGTSTANQALSIFRNGADAAIEFSTVSGANEKWSIGIDDSDGAKFKISSSSALGTNDRFTINGAGSIGIGSSDPIGKLTVVGDIYSTGLNWNTASAAQANSWQAATYGNGLFVAVSAAGSNRVMTSPDGINWTARNAAAANSWTDVTFGDGLFVAISADGTNRVMTSPNGITWTARSASEANSWRSVTYGNGLFVAVASDGTNRVMTSPDGITWTARSASEANAWRGVFYGNGKFVAVSSDGTNQVMTSTDGITWTAQAEAEANQWYGITYGEGLFVATAESGTNRIMTSPDGVTWTARSAPAVAKWSNVTYGDGLFVAVSSDAASTVMVSEDGITWKSYNAAEANNWSGVVYGNGMFVAVSNNGTNRVMYSGQQERTLNSYVNVRQGGLNILSGNVGIGTTTPGYTLSVAGNALITGALYDNAYSAGSNGMVLQSTGSGFSWVATSTLGISGGSSLFTDGGATTYLTATTDNLGLGTTTANQALSIFRNGADAAIEFSTVSGANKKWSIGIDDSDGAKFKISSSSSLGTNDRFVITGAGYVGIGTAAPSEYLTVGGTLESSNAFDGTVGIKSDTNHVALHLEENSGAEGWKIGVNASGDLTFYDSSVTTPMVRFEDGTGYVGIGTTTPGYKLTVAGDAMVTGAFRDNTYSAGSSGMVLQSTGSGFAWVATSTLGLTGSSITFGTDNQIPFTNAGGTDFDYSSNFIFDGSLLTVTGDIHPGTNLTYDLGSSTRRWDNLWAQTLNVGTSTWSIFNGSNGRLAFSNAAEQSGTEHLSILSSGNVGIGTSTPSELLTVAGNARITGALYDNSNTAGSNGMVLQSTGSGFSWVATSTLGIIGGLTSADIDTSAELAAIVGDETGTGALVFGTSPTFAGTPIFGGGVVNFSTTTIFTIPNNEPSAFVFATSSIASPLLTIDTTSGSEVVQVGTPGGDVIIGGVGTPSNLVFEEDSTIHGQGGNTLTFGQSGDIINFAVNTGFNEAAPSERLHINGGLRLTGAFKDSTNATGTLGMVLQSTGTSTRWVATSTLGFTGGGLVSADIDTSAELLAIVGDETGSGALVFGTSPTFTTQITTPLVQIDTNTTGVSLDTDGDGMLIIAGTGNGNDEDLRINLDDTADTAVFTSNTGLTVANFSGIILQESGINVLNNDEIDASSELLAIMDDETGTGALVFGTSPTFAGTPIFGGGVVNFSTTTIFTIPNNEPSAFVFATSSIASPLLTIDTTSGSEQISFGPGSGDILIGDVGATTNLVFEESATIHGQGGNTLTFGQSGDIINFAVNTGFNEAAPSERLHINGGLRLTGAFKDSTNATGTLGMVLQSTGTSTRWVATSTLGFTGGGLVSADIDTSAELAAILTDETGTGRLVFSNAPAFSGTATFSALTATSTLTLSGTAANIALGSNWLSGDGNDEGVYVSSTGNVGVGTSNPSGSKLYVSDNTSGGYALRFDQNHASGNGFYGYINSNNTNEALRLDNSSGTILDVLSNGRVGIGTTTPNSLLGMGKTSGLTGSVIAGIDQYFNFTNSTQSAVYYGDRSYIVNAPTATSTLVGKMLRIEDSTTLGNTVRGLEVQAHRGTNTQGENTALSGFARTFGVRGTTEGDAGGTYEPAGVFAETKGTTQGNAIRGYSGTITSADLLSLFQDTSTFTGTGLLMNFGNSGGSFASTSSKFIDLQNAGTSKFTISAHGTTTIGDGTTNYQAGLQIGYGGLCVDNDGSCSASTTGKITSVSSAVGNSDLAEMYFSDEALEPGEIIATAGVLSIERADAQNKWNIIGVVSTKPGLTLGFDDSSLIDGQTGYPVALSGRVPIKLSTENGPIKAGDTIALSSLPGIGMKAKEGGTIVGYALEDFDGEYAYSEGFVDQFGDDIAEPNSTPYNQETDTRIHDGCSFGGGGALGEEDEECTPKKVKRFESITSAVADRTETMREALLDLAREDAEEIELEDGKEVMVGQALMFVRLGSYQTIAQTNILNELSSTSTDIVLGGDGEETLWDRIKTLAQGFVDGVLSIAGLRAENVYIEERLCVDDVCLTSDDLRALLQEVNRPSNGSGSGEPTPPPQEQPEPVPEEPQGGGDVGDGTGDTPGTPPPPDTPQEEEPQTEQPQQEIETPPQEEPPVEEVVEEPIAEEEPQDEVAEEPQVEEVQEPTPEPTI